MVDNYIYKGLKKRGGKARPNMIADFSMIRDLSEDDTDGLIFRAHRRVLRKRENMLSVMDIVIDHEERMKRLGYVDTGLKVAEKSLKKAVNKIPLPKHPVALLMGAVVKEALKIGIDEAKEVIVDTMKRENDELLNRRMAGAFKKHNISKKEHVKELEKITKEIEAECENESKKLESSLTNNNASEGSVKTLTALLFDDMDPEEKIELIRRGLVEVDDPKEAIKKLEKQKEQKENIDTIRRGLDEGAALVQIMKDVGLDESVYAPVSEVVNVGSAVFAAAMAFSTGGVFTGVAALTGLLGGGRGEADAEIKRMLKEIGDQLQIIDEKLDKVIENQGKILARLGELQSQIAKVERNIVDNVLFNRALILAELDDEIGMLRSFQYMSDGTKVLDVDAGSIPSYEIIEGLNNDHSFSSSVKWRAANRLFSILAEGVSISKNFHYESHLGELLGFGEKPTIHTDYLKLIDVYERLIEMHNKSAVGEGSSLDLYSLINACSMPAKGIELVDDFFYQCSDNQLEIPYTATVAIKQYLISEFIIESVNVLLNVHFIPSYLNVSDRHFMDIGEYSEQTNFSTEGLFWLHNAQKLTEIAIIQQTILGGGVFLPLIYKLFDGVIEPPSEDEDEKKASLKKDVIELMKSISVFSDNIVLYGTFRRAQEAAGGHGWIHEDYKRALMLAKNDDNYSYIHMQLGTSNPPSVPRSGPIWRIMKDNNGEVGLYVDKDLTVKLPKSERMSPDSFTQLSQTVQLPILIELRNLIDMQIMSYDVQSVFHINESSDNWDIYYAGLHNMTTKV